MLTPFLFELRIVIDWMFTPTSLTFGEWLKVETIFAQVFEIKCIREYCSTGGRGFARPRFLKYLMGGAVMALVLTVLWFPLSLFAYSGALGKPNIPSDISVSLKIGNFPPLYQSLIYDSEMKVFDEDTWDEFGLYFNNFPKAQAFLQDFEAEDVVAAPMPIVSDLTWNPTPPLRKKMIARLQDMTKYCTVTFRFSISRSIMTKSTDNFENFIKGNLNETVRTLLVKMLKSTVSSGPVVIPMIFPKVLSIRNTGQVYSHEPMRILADSKSHLCALGSFS